MAGSLLLVLIEILVLIPLVLNLPVLPMEGKEHLHQLLDERHGFLFPVALGRFKDACLRHPFLRPLGILCRQTFQPIHDGSQLVQFLMTQKELGIAIGFEEKSADIRIAQYESNTRTPKEELLRKIAEVLDVNYRSLYEPTLYAAEDVMYTLFELDEHYPGTRLYEVTDTTDPDLPEKHMAVSFRYRLLDDFLKEWQLRKKQLREGEITKEEYLEWKLNWPQTADGCGRYEPKKKWRKE